MTKQETLKLQAPFELSYDYQRSCGPIMSKFFEALSKKKILGTKNASGKVFVPAAEFDPNTNEALTEFVEVESTGIIESWSWVANPKPHHLIQSAFAFVLIKFNGADTSMLHMVSECAESDLAKGVKVKPVWSSDPKEMILDIKYFVLEK